jgi:hypothetical protein
MANRSRSRRRPSKSPNALEPVTLALQIGSGHWPSEGSPK